MCVPAPILSKIGVWIWLSIIVSSIALIFERLATLHLKSEFQLSQGPLGPAIFIIAIFYDITILILSIKESKFVEEVVEESQLDQWPVPAKEKGEDDENIRTMAMWSCINYWILAVCQSGLAASGLYLAARAALFFGIPPSDSRNVVIEIGGLAFVFAEMAMLGYIATCCIVRHVEITTYMASSQA